MSLPQILEWCSFLTVCVCVSLLLQNPAIPVQKLQDIQRAMELLSACQGPTQNIGEAAKHRYQFWDTQPVPKLSKLFCFCPPSSLEQSRVNNNQKAQKRLFFTYITCFIPQVRNLYKSNTFLLKIIIHHHTVTELFL